MITDGIVGVYVVEFPDRVKIGRSQVMRSRLRQHVKGGALRVAVFSVPFDPPWSWGTGYAAVEEAALRKAEQLGTRVGAARSESFTGLTFDEARGLVRSAHRMRVVRETLVPVAELASPLVRSVA